MISYGFSAFRKLLSLNEKPQRTEIRKRAGPSTGSPYDYHRSFRLHARRCFVDGLPIAEVLASAEKIKSASERLSASAALGRLEVWRTAQPGVVVPVKPTAFESPSHLFRSSLRQISVFGTATRRSRSTSGTPCGHRWHPAPPMRRWRSWRQPSVISKTHPTMSACSPRETGAALSVKRGRRSIRAGRLDCRTSRGDYPRHEAAFRSSRTASVPVMHEMPSQPILHLQMALTDQPASAMI